MGITPFNLGAGNQAVLAAIENKTLVGDGPNSD
jgi:hypothetical protein